MKLLFDHPAIPATIFYAIVALIWWSGLKPQAGSTAELVFLFGKIFAWGLAVYLIAGWIGTAMNERRRAKERETKTIKVKEAQQIRQAHDRYKGHTEEFRRRAMEAEAQLKAQGLYGPVSDEDIDRRMEAAIAAHRAKTKP
jgi:type VI protein secretion system component VasK